MANIQCRVSVFRGLIKYSFVIMLIALSTACVSTSEHQNVLSLYNQTVKERDGLIEERSSLQGNNRLYRNTIIDMKKQAAKLGLQLDEKSESLAARQKELTAATGRLELTRAQLDEKQKRLQQASQQLDATSHELQVKERSLQATQAELEKASKYMKRTSKLYDELVGELKSELNSNQVKIKEMKDGINVNLSQEILFPSGSATLNKRGKAVIGRVSERLRGKVYKITVAGFTDNVPIMGSLTKKYPTNWELAGARAASVVRLLESGGLDKKQLIAASYGENNPVASNDTAEGQAQNRRIEIRLRPVQ